MHAPSAEVSRVGLRRALVIANPVSGAHQADAITQRLAELSAANQCELVVRHTSKEVSGADLARDAAQFDRVIVSGGDGTVTQVLGGMVGSATPLAIVPGGTGNVLAVALGLSPDWQHACIDALDPAAACLPLDLGLLNDTTYFALRFSSGYEAQVTRDTTRELKTRFGKLAYAWQAIRHALHFQAARYRFRVDGGKSFRHRAEFIWVANTGALGVLGLELDPHIRLNDGQLDLCVFRVTAMRDLRRVLQWALRKDRLPSTLLKHIVVNDRVSISASPPQPVQIDGDTVATTPCIIKVVPGAVNVCLKRKA